MQIIKISAIDGAGKSTATDGVIHKIHQNNKNSITIHWTTNSLLKYLPSRSSRSGYLLKRIFGADEYMENEVQTNQDNKTKEKKSLFNKKNAYHLLIVAKFFVVLLNYFYMIAYLKIRYGKFDYVILDRSFFDDIVQLEYLGLPGVLCRVGYRVTDTSNLYIIDVPPKLAKERDWESDGHQHPDAYYEKKVSLYRRNAEWYDIKLVDGTQEPDEVVSAIAKSL